MKKRHTGGVWHAGILYKLIYTTFPDWWTRLIGSYLSQRNYFVSFQGARSLIRPIEAVVRRGGVLGPVFSPNTSIAYYKQTQLFVQTTAILAQAWTQRVIRKKMQ